ncbi:hypothetical protein [Microbacterium sp.]|uniref:hypothetical protein n=1 Tax=Microbacterium sp. TaxID=51671 RepID=UPI003A8F2AF3
MARKGDRHRTAKQAKAQAAVVLAAPVDLYLAPSPHPMDVHEQPLQLPCGCRIIQRLQFERKALAYFAIVWVAREPLGGWEEQYSCDTAHGYFHEHVHGHRRARDRNDLRPLYTHVDVQECYDEGYDLVQNRHDRDCRRES